MFDAIQYVTSGLSLAAFVVAAGAWVYKVKADSNKNLIEISPEDRRAELVKIALDKEQIDYRSLTKEQQYQLALQKTKERIERFRISAAVVCFVAVLLAGIAIWQWNVVAQKPIVREQTTSKTLPTITLAIDSTNEVTRGYINDEDSWQPAWVITHNGKVQLVKDAIGESHYTHYRKESGSYTVYVTVKDGERETRVSNIVEYDLK